MMYPGYPTLHLPQLVSGRTGLKSGMLRGICMARSRLEGGVELLDPSKCEHCLNLCFLGPATSDWPSLVRSDILSWKPEDGVHAMPYVYNAYRQNCTAACPSVGYLRGSQELLARVIVPEEGASAVIHFRGV
jgi:hypothetical protein